MRVAIAEAELGDADEGEDPTVNRLETMAAERLRKEDAVLVTSGTQGNMVAILSQCRPRRLRNRRSEAPTSTWERRADSQPSPV